MEEHKPTGREIELGPRPERTEEPGPRDIVITPPVVEGMVLVPAGEFIMGSDDRDRIALNDEKPQRRVYLDAYYIDIYQVTNGRFRGFVRETGYKAQGGWEEYAKPGCDDHPVVCVTWYDAVEYCNWRSKREGLEMAYDDNFRLRNADFGIGQSAIRNPKSEMGYRLPTEAEWEKAARGTDGRIYPWGNDWDANKCNCEKMNRRDLKRLMADIYKGRGTLPVGCFPEGVSPYGCHDMAGNVWEWCHNWYDNDYYRHTPNRNPMGPERGTSRVLRGGSWYGDRRFVRCSSRFGYDPGDWSYNSGFRCCLPA